MFFGKQKFDIKQLKLNKFIFDVKQLKKTNVYLLLKQLKMNRFVKSISDLIISTPNATLEVPRYVSEVGVKIFNISNHIVIK